MVRSQVALKLRQSHFREKYNETSYIKISAKPKYHNFKVRIEPWMAYRMVQYFIGNCGIPSINTYAQNTKSNRKGWLSLITRRMTGNYEGNSLWIWCSPIQNITRFTWFFNLCHFQRNLSQHFPVIPNCLSTNMSCKAASISHFTCKIPFVV